MSGTRRLPRILVVSPIYPWPGMPAEGIFVHRQVRNLVRLGHDVRVINYHPAVPGLPRSCASASWLRYHPRWVQWPIAFDGVRVDHVFYPQPARRRGDAVPAITDAVGRYIERRLSDFEPDLVYAHWLWTGGAVALGLRERFGWPVAAIARGSELHRWQTIHQHCRRYVKQVIEGADLILANSGFLRERAAALVPSSARRIRVAYNGCDTSRFSPSDDRVTLKRRLGYTPGARYFLCCATIAPHKGLGDLAEAWRQVSARHPDWRLAILGPTAHKALADELRRLAPLRAELRGQVDANELALHLKAADAYVQPSRLEGLSNATMEAMATGLPVVTTDAGGQTELIDGVTNGWVTSAADPRSLAAAMESICDLPDEASHRGARARETIMNHFEALGEAARLSELLSAVTEPAATPAETSHRRLVGSHISHGEWA